MNVAVLGLGFMGASHAEAWSQVPGATVVAVVSSDARKLAGDLTMVAGNLGGPGKLLDFSRVRKYRVAEEAFEDRDIDAVDICFPTDLHAPATMGALRAGKHVLVEKPLALEGAAADVLVREAERNGRILMVGQVLRFIPAYVELTERLKAAGPVRSAFFRRRCAAPEWSPWLTDAARSGGGAFDLLIHDVDFCISLWGVPQAVRASGFADLPRGVDVLHAELSYAGMGPVIVTGGWHHPKAYPFSMEFTVVAENATFEWAFGGAALREYRADGTMVSHELPETDFMAAELAYFAECVRGNRKPERCPPEQSAQAVKLMRRILESRG